MGFATQGSESGSGSELIVNFDPHKDQVFFGPEYAGAPITSEGVIDLAGYGWETTRDVLRGWSRSIEVLDHLATDADALGAIALAQLNVLPPLLPEQVLQSGANYRKHVIDIVVAEELERGAMSEAASEVIVIRASSSTGRRTST